MERIGIVVLSLLLSCLGALPLTGCASATSLERARSDTRVNSTKIDNLNQRTTRLEGQVDQLMKCCGKKKSACKCSGYCAPVAVHDPGRRPAASPSSGDCEFRLKAGSISQTFRSQVEVFTWADGTGQFKYRHPVTGEICYLEKVPLDFKGGTIVIEIDFDLEADIHVGIRARNRN